MAKKAFETAVKTKFIGTPLKLYDDDKAWAPFMLPSSVLSNQATYRLPALSTAGRAPWSIITPTAC